jgi:hypothetical protein
MTTALLHRSDAVMRIASRLQDQTHYVIAAGPQHAADIAAKLEDIVDVEILLDNGTDLIVTTTPAAAECIAALAATPVTAIALVPKTTPTTTMHNRFEAQIPADGSRDIVLVSSTEKGPMIWPMLFVDAIDVYDPVAAMAIHASDITRQS